jgi:branched-chain amino acid transport system permease protein
MQEKNMVELVIGQLIAGLTRGLIYFTLAAGLALIFGVLRVINLAHAAFYLIAAYLTITIGNFLNLWLALLIVPIILAIFGLIIEFIFFRRLYKAPPHAQLIITFALIWIFVDIVRMVYGGDVYSLALPDSLKGFIRSGGLVIPLYYFFVLGIGGIAVLILWLLLYKSKLGNMIRACSSDPEMANALGIKVPAVFSTTFVIASYLAGLSGVMACPLTSASLGMDQRMLLVCFAVVIIGGLGNVWGALISAIFAGILESLGLIWLPAYASIFLYIIVVIVLIFRPQGILGGREL